MSNKINGEIEKHRVNSPSLPPQKTETQASGRTDYVLNQNTPCGARTRSGGSCRQPAMANGKCFRHGGRCQGTIMARKGNKNARKHGAHISGIETEQDRLMYDQFIEDMLRDFPRLNNPVDWEHLEIAGHTYVRLVKAMWGNASSGIIDELSRIFCRHLAILKVNRNQRPIENDDNQLPKSAAEYAASIIREQQQRQATTHSK